MLRGLPSHAGVSVFNQRMWDSRPDNDSTQAQQLTEQQNSYQTCLSQRIDSWDSN